MISSYLKTLSPEELRRLFLDAQAGIAIVISALFLFFLKSRDPKSGFKFREADRPKKAPGSAGPRGPDPLAEARMQKQRTLKLEGIRIDARAHEILGIRENASAGEIQRAYRDLMKRYHPDRVGRMGSREWNDAQKIAEAINGAKETMLKALQSQNPKRSGL